MRQIFIFIWFLLFFITLPPLIPIYASDLEITCNHLGCNPTNVASIFPSDMWYPGRVVSKNIKITNNSGSSKLMGIKAINISINSTIDQVFLLSIKQSNDNNIVWSGTLTQFYNAGEIKLADLSPEASEEFNFIVTLLQSAENQYQNQSTSFNLIIGFIENHSSPIPTNTPVPTETPVSSSTPSPTSTNTLTQASSQTPIFALSNNAFSTSTPTEITPTGEVLGQTNITPNISGGLSCKNPWWWPLVLFIQFLLTTILVKYTTKNTFIPLLPVNIILSSTAIIILRQYFCYWSLMIFPICVGTFGYYLFYRKIIISYLRKQYNLDNSKNWRSV